MGDVVSGSLPTGFYPQFYRDAQRGDDAAALERAIIEWGPAVGTLVRGVAMHSVGLEMSQDEFAGLASVCRNHGLLALAAFGLGDSHPELYGRAIGAFANRSDCAGVVFDCEGVWENEIDDRADAAAMMTAYRSVAPNAFTIDQPWPVPTVHSRFPDEEFARAVDLRCSQDYFNDWKPKWGKTRYARCLAWFAKAQTTLDARLAARGIATRRGSTIQGYEWEDIFPDLIDCLLRRASQVTLVWCDPLPSRAFVLGLLVLSKLRDLGFTGPDAVRAFQASTRGVLMVDGRCGRQTAKALGFTTVQLDAARILPLGV